MRWGLIIGLATLFFIAASAPVWGGSYEISPSDDAFVREDSGSRDSNFGNEDTLATHYAYPSVNIYRSYLKFNLSRISINEPIMSATLYLYQFNGAGYVAEGAILHHVSDDDWDEGSITWNNRPNDGVVEDILHQNEDGPSHRDWSSWNLLASGAWDSAADVADGDLSLLLKQTEGGTASHNWYSMEYTDDPNLQPYMLIITSPVVATPGAHDFGIIEVGCTAEQSFMIKNQGSQLIEIDTITVTGVDAADFSIQYDGCSGESLSQLGSCTFDIVYEPMSTGARNAEIMISLTDPEINKPNIPLTADSREVCTGNFDGDNDTDDSDLAIFAADFGRTDCDGNCEGDFDGDGDVDGSDLATFAADFGRTDCPVCP